MFYRAELKKKAKQAMQGNWTQILPTAGLLAILYTSLNIASANSDILNLGDLLMLLLEGPLMISFCIFMLHLLRHNTVHIQQFFDGFSNFVKWMLAGLWQTLWLTLWTLLFVIPGIVKFFSYSQYYFILADNPDADLRQALKTSMKMTKGYKADLFVAYLSFLNWILLIFVAYFAAAMLCWPNEPHWLLDIVIMIPAYLFLMPYMTGTFAGIYESLKETALANGTCSPEEFGLSEMSASVQLTAVEAIPQDESNNYQKEE